MGQLAFWAAGAALTLIAVDRLAGRVPAGWRAAGRLALGIGALLLCWMAMPGAGSHPEGVLLAALLWPAAILCGLLALRFWQEIAR